MKLPSRNKRVEHDWYFYCPYCKTKHLKEELEEDIDYEKFSENTIIVYCKNCGWEFIPNKTRDITYKYS